MNKIQGKFYPMQLEEFLSIRKLFTPSQRDVLYYIHMLDPYSNGIKLKASNIAKDLEISRQAVYKAFDALEEKGFIVREDVEYTVKIKGFGYFSDTNSTGTRLSTDGDTVNSPRHLSNASDTSKSTATVVNSRQQKAPETPSIKQTQAPKIIKTYKDFKDSLSTEERESFEKFASLMANSLPSPPQLPKKWVAKNWEEIRDKWLLSTNKPSEAQTHKWADHPQREEWLEKINTLGFGAFIIENGDFDDERKEFVDWALSSGLTEY
ncbi:hypothetical protein CAL7716_056800 [Calothrix sp. PCC 7716]|nr:hypothetical protein CAL7716_056800 [Calothrix sp. PCC 7716]